MDRPDWLPLRLNYRHYHNDWYKFIEDAYEIFVSDFHLNQLYLGNKLIDFDHRIVENKFEGFRHIIEGGMKKGLKEDDNSIIRAERIGWIKPIIVNYLDSSVCKWENKRDRKTKHLLWLKDVDDMGFIVVLYNKNEQELFLETAYPITWKNRRFQIEKEYNAYMSSKRRPK